MQDNFFVFLWVGQSLDLVVEPYHHDRFLAPLVIGSDTAIDAGESIVYWMSRRALTYVVVLNRTDAVMLRIFVRLGCCTFWDAVFINFVKSNTSCRTEFKN